MDDAKKTDNADNGDNAVDTKGGQPAEAMKRQRAKSLSNLVFQAKKWLKQFLLEDLHWTKT